MKEGACEIFLQAPFYISLYATDKFRYKDIVFRKLFSDKESLLSLYNAVAKKDYKSYDNLTIVTLDNVIYMGMKNDIAFVLETNLYLYEHQSTMNPNIPYRIWN